MPMKDQLYSILSKYPFIHIDTVGELTMLVPLTGARTVTADFTAGTGKTTSLYLFGDNTCQSDIERQKFFKPNGSESHYSSFTSLFSSLIRELEGLKRTQQIEKDGAVIQSIIDTLNEQKKEAIKLKDTNPDTALMQNDFCHGTQGFTVKGEFIVSGSPDNVRHLNLPNILNLTINGADRHKFLPSGLDQDNIFTNLAYIPKKGKVEKKEDPLDANIRIAIRSKGIKTYQKGLTQNPAQLFQTVYSSLKNSSFKEAPDQSDEFFDGLANNLKMVYGDTEDYSTYTENELIEATVLILRQTGLFIPREEKEESKRFSTIYHPAIQEFSSLNGASNTTKIKTFKLFTLQTFLYVCALQLRLKNTDDAKTFLSELQKASSAEKLIAQLCKNESEFMHMLETQYGISTPEYEAIVDATFEIITDHVEVPHFDELKVACLSEELEKAHYIVLGGRLCWSTVEITENGNINSEEQKKERFKTNFEQFFEHAEAYLDRREHLRSLNEWLKDGAEYEEIALQSLEYNAEHFSYSQKLQLLETAIIKKKYLCAEFLVAQGVHNDTLFELAFKQSPANMQLINCFARVHNSYMMNYATARHLATAIRENNLDFVKIILTLAPNLLETQLPSGCTPLLYACDEGKTRLVDYFMSIGANVLATSTTQTTAEKLAEHSQNQSAINRLLTDYHLRVREQLNAGNNFPFLSTPEYFLTALKRGKQQLVAVLLEFFPELKNAITIQVLIEAIRNNSLPTVQAILAIKPELLNEVHEYGKTPLFYACQLKSTPIAQHLMGVGADIFKADSQGTLPRDAALTTEIRDLFIPYYQRLSPDSEQYQAIFTSENYRLAIMRNDFGLADCILQAHPEFINEITHEDIFNAINFDSLEAVEYILKHKPELLEYKNQNNKTPFFYACEINNLAIARYLMMQGANIHAGEITAFQPTAASYSGYTLRRVQDLSSQAARSIVSTYSHYLHNIPVSKFNAGHIIDAIDARDLRLTTYLLNRKPDLRNELSEIDLQHVKQQQMQERLYSRYEQLIQELHEKRDTFPYSNQKGSPYVALSTLSNELKVAGEKFFKTHASSDTVQQFDSACTEALNTADQVLSIHRGWHGFPLWMRAIVGIIATVTLIPAITVHATTSKGYVGTFFKSYETDSVMRTKQFASEFETMKTELLSVI